jgi:hypothetical protein
MRATAAIALRAEMRIGVVTALESMKQLETATLG